MENKPHLKDNARKFITAEALSDSQEHEKKVWDAVRRAFTDRECLGYSHYPLYQKRGEQRDEPDIVVADKELGLTVIEVRPYTIDNITEIEGDTWRLTDYSADQSKPTRVAEKKLKGLISHCEKNDRLFRVIGGRAFVALPNVSKEEWKDHRFDQKVGAAGILFTGDLGKKTLQKRVENETPIVPVKELEDEQWRQLQGALGGTTFFQETSEERTTDTTTRAGVITELRERLHSLDLQQEHIGKEIPPGPQRIRGIAGSGKTVLLCQKAAQMHLKHPEWDIALVFFTRSLYDQIESFTERWVKQFSSGDRKTYNSSRLHILHAWGAKEQPGLYREICTSHGINPSKYRRNNNDYSPTEQLADMCRRLLGDNDITPMYDAVLIDEGQDLVVTDELRYEDRQPIYWLAYEALRSPGDPDSPRRLIWAYDEAQSLGSLKIPQAKELFGEDLSRIVSGTYPGGIKKSEIMSRCYRTPGPILVAAHALGMGLKRDGEMIAGFTRQEDWEAIGYEVEGNFTASGNEITLLRPEENSPNPVPDLWDGDVIEFETFHDRGDEADAVARKIRRNIDNDGLSPSRDILVIVLGDQAWGAQRELSRALNRHGVDSYLPTAPALNTTKFKYPNIDGNRFWHEGGVTVSRIHRAKGNEAECVYIVGVDTIARNESNANMRNQLFVALTRSKGWAYLSGTSDYNMYDEIRDVLDSGNMIIFNFSRPTRDLGDVSQTDMFE